MSQDLFKINEMESKRICEEYPKQIQTIFSDYYCELQEDFLGFLSSYYEMKIPNDFTIIDIGCYKGVQSVYFQNHKSYIGIDFFRDMEPTFKLENNIFYNMSGQNFIQNELKKLLTNGLNLNKTFAICSYVPDEDLWNLVRLTFPFHKIIYCEDIISESYPYKL